MSSEKPIFFFEPVRILINQKSEGTLRKISDDEDFEVMPGSEFGSDYFFNKVVVENKEEFEALNIKKEIMTTLTSAYTSTAEKLKAKLSSLVPADMTETLLNLEDEIDEYTLSRAVRRAPGLLYIHKKSTSLLIPSSENNFCILSNKPKNVKTLLTEIKSRYENLNKITKDFGLELQEFMTSKEYQRFILEKVPNIDKIEFGDPKNEFEKEVIEVFSHVTTSFLSNVIVNFKEPHESFEYDIFIDFPRGSTFIVEPTDYSKIKEEITSDRVAPETLKSKIVLATMDKAQRLDAKGIVIVNGFPDNTFAQLKTIATSRGLILLNEKNYKEELPNILCNSMLRAFSRTPLRYARGVVTRFPR